MNRVLRYALVLGGAVMSILLFLLASASENSGFFDRYYVWLLGTNAAAALTLLLLVGVSVGRLVSRFRSGQFGSKLIMRLVLLFAGIGILPGLLIFIVSVQFVSHSIDSWFNVRIEQALQSGLNLGRTAIDESLASFKARSLDVAATLADQDRDATRFMLARHMRKDTELQSIIVASADGKSLLALAGGKQAELRGDMPTQDMLTHAMEPGGYGKLEGGVDFDAGGSASALDAAMGLRMRVVLPIPDRDGGPQRFLQLLQAAPVNLVSNTDVLRAADREYTQRNLERSGLRKMYIETLTLTLLLAIFGALVASFFIADDLAKPLLVLAEGTKAVAEGDLSPRPIVETRDELGTLTQSFNAMTGQLFDARSAVERNRAALQSAKAHLESVLENMSAGVLVFDAEFRVVNSNEAGLRILQCTESELVTVPLGEVAGMEAFAASIKKAFSTQSARTAARSGTQRTHWQQEIEIPRPQSANEEHAVTLLARGSRLPVDSGAGYIVVFDDISDVISAQRSIAWGEVARRLAHEIKNPLTPIQLSAERLQMKLEGSLTGSEAELLKRGTTTIVNQVTAMKHMVDDFRDYARTPPAVLQPLDLNSLIDEILHLYLRDEGGIIHPDLAPGLPRVMGDATQLRQVIHNLLQNAQDAMADRAPSAAAPAISVTTEAVHFESAEGGAGMAVRMAIVDNGPGFSPKILARAFEPYVTTKARGTGLGLPMVKKIIDEHGGRIEIQNHPDGAGASVVILLLKLAQAVPLA